MPDAHSGYSLPIGAVVPTDGVVVPVWIGFDIGCGMIAVRTSFDVAEVRTNAKTIFDNIYRDVPVGFAHHKASTPWVAGEALPKSDVLKSLWRRRARPIFTRSAEGNHFIEIGADEQDRVWIVIHSGSRGLGHSLASVAAGDGKAREGHYALAVDSTAGRDYLTDLAYGLAYALENRRGMIERIGKVMTHRLSAGEVLWDIHHIKPMINIKG